MAKLIKIPEGEIVSRLYDITVDGETAQAYEARVSAMPYNTPWPGRERPLDQTELAAFISLESAGAVEFTVKPRKAFTSAVVRPLSKGVRPVVEEKSVRFTLPGPGQYVFEAEDFHGALHIFVNPPAEYDLSGDVLYYGAGVHEVGDVFLRSGQTVYVDEGAVVYGAFIANDCENVRVLGRGVIDGSHEIRTSNTLLLPYSYTGPIEKGQAGYDKSFGNRRVLSGILRFFDCRNVTVEGVTLRDSSSFTVIPARCDGVVIENIKTIGMYRYNSDGIDLFNSVNVTVKNSFLRNYDDCMVIKGICGWDDWNNENITVTGCVVWCDWGRALELGAETNAPEYKHILFEDCDVIHGCDLCMDVQHHNRAKVSDVTFRNIRCEYNRAQLNQQLQEHQWDEYDASRPGSHPFLMGVYVLHDFIFCPADKYESGTARDITFEDVEIYADEGVPMPTSNFIAYSEENNIEDVKIRNVRMNGKPVEELSELKINMSDFVGGVSYTKE